MCFVVVSYILVALLNLDCKLNKPLKVKVYSLKAIALSQDPWEQTQHLVAVSQFTQAEDIEFVIIRKVQHIDSFVAQMKHLRYNLSNKATAKGLSQLL